MLDPAVFHGELPGEGYRAACVRTISTAVGVEGLRKGDLIQLAPGFNEAPTEDCQTSIDEILDRCFGAKDVRRLIDDILNPLAAFGIEGCGIDQTSVIPLHECLFTVFEHGF